MEALAIICCFVTTAFVLCSTINHKGLRAFVAFCCTLFIAVQCTSLYFTQSFVGYQFYVHCNLSGINGFKQSFALLIAATLAASAVLFALLMRTPTYKRVALILLLPLLIVAAATNPKLRRESSTLRSIFVTEAINFQHALNSNQMAHYTLARHLDAHSTEKKNIVVLSLESYERSLLCEEQFQHLTPHLRMLKQGWHYYNVEQNIGSSWTSGSIYTLLTGFPALFGVHGNSIFQSSYHTEIASLPTIMHLCGYHTSYLIGNAEHSGVYDMLTTLGIDTIIDDRIAESITTRSNYGLHDYDLFHLAKAEIARHHQAQQPLALFISTTDTHAPNGLLDRRLESTVDRNDTSNDMEFMIKAVDQMVGQFVCFLDSIYGSDQYAIFILPDHLKMGSPAMYADMQRGLYLITNTSPLLDETTERIEQIDLPKLILSGCTINHNATFLTDFIVQGDTSYIATHIPEITSININGLLRSDSTRIATGY